MLYLDMEWEHLFTYRRRQTLPLHDLGLVLVKGINRKSAALSSNGVGKTGIFSIMNWIKFGESLPGHKGTVARGDAVACRFTEEQGEGVFTWQDSDGTLNRIIRCCRPSNLEFYRRDVPVLAMDMRELQTKIETALGYGPRLFRNAVILPQGSANGRFAQSDQSDAMRMLDEIQNVDFRKPLDRAKRWRDEWWTRLNGGEATLLDGHKAPFNGLIPEANVLKERLAGAKTKVVELELSKAKFAATKQEAIKIAEDEALRKTAAVVDKQRLHADLLQKLDTAKTLRAIWNEWVTLFNAVGAAITAFDRAKQNADYAFATWDNLAREVEELIAAGKCPKCRIMITAKVAQHVRQSYVEDLETAKGAYTRANTTLEGQKTALEAAQRALDTHKAAHPKLTEQLVLRAEEQASDPAVLRAKKEIEAAVHDAKNAEQAVIWARENVWTGEDGLLLAKQLIVDTELALKRNELAQKQANLTLAAAEYWVEAFGDRGIRSLMFESVEPYLNERLAIHLAELTAGEAETRVSSQTAYKKGTVRDKMSVNTIWEWGANTYDLGSGGQDCRIDIAMFTALQDLAESRSARPFPIKAFDEPSDGLDSLGKEILAEWMKKLIAERSTVFVVSHDDTFIELLEPDKVLTVTLDDDGSFIELGEGQPVAKGVNHGKEKGKERAGRRKAAPGRHPKPVHRNVRGHKDS